jgi:tRNA A-37 threonylcarbamoyl transferase component Bud32
METMVGQVLGHYRIEAELGRGGMGVVYRAHDPKLRRAVAIKVLREGAIADDHQRQRLAREAQAASALNHPNIITVHDIDTTGGTDFIAMEYVAGKSLQQLIGSEPFDVPQVVHAGLQLASALAAAHAAGIVHRDIKPANILVMADGRLKVVDFGLASASAPAAADASTRLGIGLAGDDSRFCGTPGYAAPEQIEASPIGPQADVFAIGAVLYEMLAGRPAFGGASPPARIAGVMQESPAPLRSRRRDVPADLDGVITRCLEKAPDARFSSAVELLDHLKACHARLTHERVPARVLLRRPAVLVGVVVLCLAALAAGSWFWLQQSRVRWARNVALPQAERLIAEGKAFAAFRILRQAERYASEDPVLRDLLTEVTTNVAIQTTPAGAEVSVRDFFDDPHQWESLGHAPLEAARLPAGILVWKVTAPGFQTSERLAGTMIPTVSFALPRVEDARENMIWIEGGSYELFSTPAVQLGDYWIDKYEVTNRQFKSFVDSGGYEEQKHWAASLVNDPQRSWDDSRRRFRDRTGRPGPATWEFGSYVDGEDDHPVAGVSWYEAAAYCAWTGKQLPTIYHWYHGAFLEGSTPFARFANFAREKSGPGRVGDPHALGWRGPFDMAGNVKEWSSTSAGSGRHYILGGGWNEPSYMFRDHDAQPSFERAPMYGFRCALYSLPLAPQLTAPVEAPTRDYRLERPVDDRIYEVFQRLYAHDPVPLHARTDHVDDSSPHWRIERINFAASYDGERVPALLYLPKNARAPYQTVVWFPGGNAFFPNARLGDAEGERHHFLPVVRGGRAVLYPTYKGSHERYVGIPLEARAWREILVHSAKDLGQSIDYLATRKDIDSRRLAYYGLSFGAGVGPIMTAVERRFRASILVGGGLYFWSRPPELEPFNFLPRVRTPTLMINGRHDMWFPVDRSQEPMFRLLGVDESEKRHRIFDSGHVPTEWGEVVKEILDWLDRHLGPVTRG